MKLVKYSGLLAEMKRHGHTQSALAKFLNISESSISRRFSGETDWSISEINKICEYYNKSYDELFN